jgi:hypothetical protein
MQEVIAPIQTKRRWLQPDETPTMDFVIEMPDGSVGEAESPFYLCDLLFHPNYTDCDDPRTWFILQGQRLRDIASQLSMERLRVTVFDAKGAFFDNTISRFSDNSKRELVIENPNTPKILDGFNPFTAIKSLVEIEYIRLWEKAPTFSEQKKVQDCGSCIFNSTTNDGTPFCKAWDYEDAQYDWSKPCWWVTNSERYESYKEVTKNNVCKDMSHKATFRPVSERNDEYIGYRYENIKEAMEADKDN